ncbi:hypothetical protein AA11826_0002 [Komagataeibacter oboediens DSM 11826]|uniref:HNH nuclease domain-containing protein n=1 Tax=Komagataeibacter oboediens TaxID=65958 RepID=A0A318QLQ2_9PROT|nr:HNH endonuclease [Komagataeibacter oboediens]PYD78202.1 hypothetical protein CFR80_16820 [Komagataeibacter oboediens]GBR26997.1 hypothetical protein AA11826_0002 [Komagataeibacter oboediens DSM 11826]
MARIRSIHPGLWTDEDFVNLSPVARLFYIGIWSEADDQGAFAWKPITLKARILPADNVDALSLLQEMIDSGVIRKADDDGSPIGLLKNFCKWQRPKKPVLHFTVPEELRAFVGLKDEDEGTNLRKAIWARFEGRCFYCATEVTYYSKKHNSLEIDHVVPVSKGGSDDDRNLACACRNCNRSKNNMSANEFFAFRKLKKLPVSEGFANTINGHISPELSLSHCEKENSQCENGFRVADGGWRRKEEGSNISPSLRSGSSSSPSAEAKGPRAAEFDEFWAAYPRHVGKDAARKAHTKARTRAAQAEIMLGLSRQVAAWPDRKSDRAQFIPYPASWLNSGGWQDDPSASAAAAPSPSTPQRNHGRPAIWDAVPDHPGV